MSHRKSSRLTVKQEAKAALAGQVAPIASTSRSKTNTRPQKKRKISAASELVAEKPMKKRSPTTRDNVPIDTTDYSRVRGRRGKLKLMTEMPLDILLEIFSELEPLDLLHISRATKDLRAIVTNPTHAFLWIRVYENAPAPVPPPCPPGMSILHYTNLVYGRHCHFCASIHGRVIHWNARVRLCSKCAPSQLLKKHFPGSKISLEALSLCHHIYMRKAGGLGGSGVYALVLDYKQQVKALAAAKATGGMALEDYKAQRNALFAQRNMEMAPHRKWAYDVRRHRLQQQDAVRSRRQQMILDKLHEEGYTEVQSYPIWRLPGVRVAAELTDKEWKLIKFDLMNVFEDLRRQAKARDMEHKFYRRTSHLRAVFTEASKDIPAPQILPPIGQIANCEPFLSLLKGTPIEDEITMEQVQALAGHLPGIFSAWREECDAVLLSLIPGSQGKPNKMQTDTVDRQPLELATTFFKCFACDEPITYPRILVHSCVRYRRPPESDGGSEKPDEQDQKIDDRDTEDDSEEDESKDDADTSSHQAARTVIKRELDVDFVWSRALDGVWDASGNRIMFDEEASRYAEVVIQAFGEDPQTVTQDQMNQNDGRIECISCRVEGKKPKRLVMDWKTAILHDMDYHFEDPPKQEKWQPLTEEADLVKAKDTEAKASKRWRTPSYHCRHCDRYPIDGKRIKEHLESHRIACEHNAYDLRQDAVPLLDTSIRMPPYAVKI
ncbi:unnamed protein product [Cyclocybe aegerita]|uniref:F-box domain-containing protein n=1 Tax=Cyclocybe aegerita TaxID=1973307 RepID=A0A8S0XWM8_CYCAE|nr:unnamed protein product [Cyclocybe aegerita]